MEYFIANQNMTIFTFVRIMVILQFAIFFNNKNFMAWTKIAFAIFMTLLIAPSFTNTIIKVTTVGDFVRIVIGEVLIGLEIGLVLKITTDAFAIIGEITGNSSGMGMAQMFDFNSNSQSSVFSKAFVAIATLFFLVNNLHYQVIDIIYTSFKSIPIGYFEFNSAIIKYIIMGFVYGCTLAIPIMGAIFIIDVVLGITTRTIPQINIFTVGFIIKIIVGITLVYVYMFFFNQVLIRVANATFQMALSLGVM